MLVFIRTFLFLAFVPQCTLGGDLDCTLFNDGQLNITDYNGDLLDMESSSGEDVTLEDGKTYTVQCSVDGFQFVNGVRRTKGVDVFTLDQGDGLSLSCSSASLSPDIAKDTNENTRILYCDEGCAPFREDLYDVSYPSSIVTSEENSPPLIYNNFMSVTLACQSGYTRSAGDVGKDSVLCEKDSDSGAVAWSTDSDNIIDCISGCTDITQDVSNGITTDKASTTSDTAPFTPGDTVTFSCDAGYTLVGYSTLTCTGANTWSENTPECVYVSA